MTINHTSPQPPASTSAFSRASQRYIDNGISVIPIAPGTKRPGEYSGNTWRGMSQWERFATRLPTELELDHFTAWPDAGIGAICGKISNIVGVDVDTDDKFILTQFAAIMPPSPVRKKGRKGFTSFYRYSGEANLSWNVAGQRVMDLLSDGRQTLMPGTSHPEGMTYVYLTDDTLQDYDTSTLPVLPKDFAARMDRVLSNMQTDEDKQVRRVQQTHVDSPGEVLAASFSATLFREVNTEALHRIDEWVPILIPGAKPNADGYRCQAFWRGAQDHNIGVSRKGIRDFGGDAGLTAIDLVMFAQNVSFQQAFSALQKILKMEPEVIEMTVNGVAHGAPPALPAPDDSPARKGGRKKGIESIAREALAAVPVDMRPPRVDSSFDPAAVLLREQQQRAADDALELPTAPSFVLQAPGMIGRIAGWMAETAPKNQPELFVAAALALAATVMGRQYCTNWSNYPSLYIVMVAKSTEGKEHPQGCVTRILQSSGLSNLLAGSGYTSAGALFSALVKSPSHIAIIDEIGKLLKSSRAKGNTNGEGAIDKLTELSGKLDSMIVPPNYSTMALNAQQIAGLADRTVHNPAITILGATTPGTFYESLTNELIKEGFLGRVIVVHSQMPRQVTRRVDKTDPPADVVQWCKDVTAEAATVGDLSGQMNYAMPATPVRMTFAPGCARIIDAFDLELLPLKERYEPLGLDSLIGRTSEKALRVAMIVAKATNAKRDNVIKTEALLWAIEYVRFYDLGAIKSVQTERSNSEIERHIKDMITFIKGAKKFKDTQFTKILKLGGMPHAKLMRLSKLEKRVFDSVIITAIEAGYIAKTDGSAELGYAGSIYWLRSDVPEYE